MKLGKDCLIATRFSHKRAHMEKFKSILLLLIKQLKD